MNSKTNGMLEARNRTVMPVEHGGPDFQELGLLGLNSAQILDFSVCTNPFGPSPRVYAVLSRVALEQYPDRESQALRSALAKQLQISPSLILAGNGVSELIGWVTQAFVRSGVRVLIIGPTYGEYARSALLQGGVVRACNAREEENFAPRIEEIEATLTEWRPSLVFLCNPNNPTGTTIAPEVIVSWARRNPHTLFIVDEAYQQFASELPSLIPVRESNLLVLRSMTKDYALAGLRIGYAVGAERIIQALIQVRPPWSVNALAQAAASAALGDLGHLAQSLIELAKVKGEFVRDLVKLGLTVLPSAAHFFLAGVGNASTFRQTMLKRGILVRDATSFGLPGFVRLATRRPEDNARFVKELREVSW